MGYGLSMAGRALTGTYLKNAYQTRSSEDFFYARQASVPTRQKGCSSYFGPATASYYGYFLWVLLIGTYGYFWFLRLLTTATHKDGIIGQSLVIAIFAQ